MSNYQGDREVLRQPLGYDMLEDREESDKFIKAFCELSERNHSTPFYAPLNSP